MDLFQIDQGWLPSVTRVESPNYDARPPGTQIDLVVIHSISLPPGLFGGPYIEQLFLNELEPEGHDYFEKVAGTRVSAHFLKRVTTSRSVLNLKVRIRLRLATRSMRRSVV